MRHEGMIKIGTDRVILRKFTIDDADVMYRNWASEDEVTKYLTWKTHENVDVTRKILEDWIQKYSNLDYYNWGIQLKETGELIGNLSVAAYEDKTASAIIEGCIGTRFWGQGIMPEAAGAIMYYLFNEIGFKRISAKYDDENPRAKRVIQKIGMTYEGTLRANGKNNRGIVDEAWYSIMKDEYKKNYGKSIRLVWILG